MSIPDIFFPLFGIDTQALKSLFARATISRGSQLVELVFDRDARQFKRKDTGRFVTPQPVPGDVRDYVPPGNLAVVIETRKPDGANAYFSTYSQKGGQPISLVQYYRI